MSNYLIEGGRVAYFDDYYFRKPLPMPQADAASFEPVDRWFARDRNHVYFLYNIVEEAAPASFAVLGGYNDFWAKDAGQAWYFCPKVRPRSSSGRWPAWTSPASPWSSARPFVKYAAGDGQVIWYRGKRQILAAPRLRASASCRATAWARRRTP